MEVNNFTKRELYHDGEIQMREEGDKQVIAGDAIMCDVETVLYEDENYREIEIIDRSCIKPEFIEAQGMFINAQHKREKTFGKQGKNLNVITREDRVSFECTGTSALFRETRSLVDDGVYTGCSFEFYPGKYDITQRRGADGKQEYVCRHTEFKSVGALTVAMQPAYKQTSVGLRELWREQNPEEEKPEEEVPEVNQTEETPVNTEDGSTTSTEERENIQSNIATEMENNNNFAAELQELREQNNEIKKSLSDAVMKLNEREAVKAEKKTLTAMIREAYKGEEKTFTIREAKTATVGNIGGNVVATEIQSVLEPLYAKSVFNALGVRHYTGIPMGDLSVPVMGKGNVGWEGEIDEAKESKNSWNNVTLKPHRLTAFVDISKQLILQENVGANEAIHRDIVNALKDEFEATVLGSGDGSTGSGETKKTGVAPVGLFNGKTLKDATTFAKLVDIEADIENANITGECKYVLSVKAKSDLRTMPTNGNGSKRVMEGGTVDGTSAIATSNVATAGAYIYGDWSNLAVATWDGVEITVDPYTQATKGCIRLVINAYMDAKVLRPEAFAYGKTRA